MKAKSEPEAWAATRLPVPPRTKLRKLLPALDRVAPSDPDTPLSPDDWLGLFTLHGENVLEDREPDFPTALARFREALTAAKAGTDPPYDPPASFRSPALTRAGRAADWRTPRRFPALWDTWRWPAEMTERAMLGIPPVTEVEFAELTAWFAANEAEVVVRVGESVVLNGKRVSLKRVRRGLKRGPRVPGAGKTAKMVRELRSQLGDAVVFGSSPTNAVTDTESGSTPSPSSTAINSHRTCSDE